MTIITRKKFWAGFFRLWNYFGLDNCFLCAAVLCTVGCLSAPLASISKVRITPTSNFDNKNTSPDLTECLRVFLNHLWLRTTRTGIFRHNTSYFREKHLSSRALLLHPLSPPFCVPVSLMYFKENFKSVFLGKDPTSPWNSFHYLPFIPFTTFLHLISSLSLQSSTLNAYVFFPLLHFYYMCVKQWKVCFMRFDKC